MGEEKKILLMGNPNVGKSVIFSKLTGVNVDCSNYTGTTIDYTIGDIKYGKEKGILIDVPGIYSLNANSEAEDVAISLLKEGADAIIYVLDATHLERNLDLAYKLREFNIPIIYSLNLSDVAKRQGIKIDTEKLSKYLDSPVIETIAIKNIGLTKLLKKSFDLSNTEKNKLEPITEEERWIKVGKIAEDVQKVEDREISFIDKLENWTIQPWPGIPIAIIILLISMGIIVGGGKALRSLILLPLIRGFIVPSLERIVSLFIGPGILRNLLVGEFGILSIGIEWPFALILPYVLLFYIVFSFLEDSGYLPRIGVLADGLLRKIGIQGGNIIPIMLGYGCAVPAILGTRASTSEKERKIVAALIAFGVPCASQSAAFISLLGDKSLLALIFVYLISFLIMILVGILMNKIIPGKSQPMLLEVPNLLIPDKVAFKTKLKIRMEHFFIDAEGPMLIGIFIAALIAETGVLNGVSKLLEPFVETWLGLPKETSLALLLGIIRRELAVLPLLELNLNILQLIVGSIVALFYLPCLSVFGVLAEEFSIKYAISIAITTTLGAFFFGGIVNHLGQLIIALG